MATAIRFGTVLQFTGRITANVVEHARNDEGNCLVSGYEFSGKREVRPGGGLKGYADGGGGWGDGLGRGGCWLRSNACRL